MTLAACAALVERADPDRFRAAMASPPDARRILFPLYAFNAEVARAPWVTAEPMIAQMRLQWWRDALAEIAGGGPVRRHEVVDPLAEVLDADGAACLTALVDARETDVARTTLAGEALDAYLDATSGGLMWTAARLSGGAEEDTVRRFGTGTGMANLLRALPRLEAAGWRVLGTGEAREIHDLAGAGLARLNYARRGRGSVSRAAAPALLGGWLAAPMLARARQFPDTVRDGTLEPGALRQSLRLATLATFGWWR